MRLSFIKFCSHIHESIKFGYRSQTAIVFSYFRIRMYYFIIVLHIFRRSKFVYYNFKN